MSTEPESSVDQKGCVKSLLFALIASTLMMFGILGVVFGLDYLRYVRGYELDSICCLVSVIVFGFGALKAYVDAKS